MQVTADKIREYQKQNKLRPASSELAAQARANNYNRIQPFSCLFPFFVFDSYFSNMENDERINLLFEVPKDLN